MNLDKNIVREIVEQLKNELIPIGSILIYSSGKVPHGYLPCDGSELSKKAYPELYALIGGTWGETKDSFFLPDLQGQFIRGWDKDGDIDPDRKFGKLQADAFQGHSHDICISSIDIESAGQHDHDLYWGKFNVRDHSVNSVNNHTQSIPVPYANRSDSGYSRIGTDYESKDGSTLEGTHTHKLSIKNGQQFIGTPIDSIHGPVTEKIATETRPTNMALMFCIKVK